MSLSLLRSDLKELLDDDYVSDDEANRMIARAEKKIERDLIADGTYKPRQVLASAELTTTDSGITLPADFMRARQVKLGTNNLRYASADKMRSGSTPEGSTVYLTYYARMPALGESTSNWLYDLADDVYLYASAVQHVLYNRDDARVQLWSSVYMDAIAALKQSNAPQPTGGWIQHSGRPYNGLYTIEGDTMRFDA